MQESATAILGASGDFHITSADELCRNFADMTFGRLAEFQGKARWCDKSLSTITHVSLVERLYPAAQYICLFRECTDTVMSGLDASPWGFGGYGYLDFVRPNPDNLIFSLVRMWVEKTSQLCSFIDTHPKSAFPLRYEDLLSNPATTLRSVFDFLNCKWDPRFATEDHIFGTNHGRGRGDHKIESAQRFGELAGGAGWRLPRAMLPELLRTHADSLSARLGYPALNDIFDKPFGEQPLVTFPTGALQEFLRLLRKAVDKFTFTDWHFGPGVIIVRDQLAAIELDILKRKVQLLKTPHTDFGQFDFRIVTDEGSIQEFLSGRIVLGSAMRHGKFNLGISGKVALGEHEMLFGEITELLRIVEVSTRNAIS